MADVILINVYMVPNGSTGEKLKVNMHYGI